MAILSQTVANLTKMDQIQAKLIAKCDSLHLPGLLQQFCETLARDLVWLVEKFGQEIYTPPYSPFAACSIFNVCEVDCCNTNTVPEQLHIAFTNDSTQMSVTWVTLQPTASHVVQYGEVPAPGFVNLSLSASGITQVYSVAGWKGFIHMAVMTGLEPASMYSYRVGDAQGGWSQNYSFWTQAWFPQVKSEIVLEDPRKGWPGNPNEMPLVFGVVGDMGMVNSQKTIAALSAYASNYSISQVLHVGDISYADFFEGQWDVYMRTIEPFAARLPYHVLPGNHECPVRMAVQYAQFIESVAGSLQLDAIGPLLNIACVDSPYCLLILCVVVLAVGGCG